MENCQQYCTVEVIVGFISSPSSSSTCTISTVSALYFFVFLLVRQMIAEVHRRTLCDHQQQVVIAIVLLWMRDQHLRSKCKVEITKVSIHLLHDQPGLARNSDCLHFLSSFYYYFYHNSIFSFFALFIYLIKCDKLN